MSKIKTIKNFQIEIHKNVKGYYGDKARTIVTQACEICEDLESVRRSFEYDADRVPRKTGAIFNMSYKMKEINLKGKLKLELYHTTQKNTLLMTITMKTTANG